MSAFELFVFAGSVLAIDQWSKALVRIHFSDRCISWGSILRIRLATDATRLGRWGVAPAAMVLVWLFALFSSIVLVRSGAWFQSQLAHVGLAAAFSGAASNLLDMLRRRPIVDFIDLGWWPVFNLADVAIVSGLSVALWFRP